MNDGNEPNGILAGSFYVDSKSTQPDDYKELSFGEKLVSLTFNPSGDEKVLKAKQLCAELADLVNESFYSGNQDDKPLELRHKLFDHTIGEILNAQMNVVKVLTLQY